MIEAKTIKTPIIHNYTFYCIGGLFLIINKIRHATRGYTNPRTFPISEIQKAVEYDFEVVNNWTLYLNKYLRTNETLQDKTILELGPGADLGVGLILLSRGCKKYNAMDINNLVNSVPEEFYKNLFVYIENSQEKKTDLDSLRQQLKLTQQGNNDKLNYICHKSFDITIFKDEKVDYVFSQAAFEHFDNVENTIRQLSEVVKKDGVLIAQIDLKTHTRWIRDLDPLNIYRYNDFMYNLFKFSGSPNRLRPFDYENILKKYGWTKIMSYPLLKLDEKYLLRISKSLNKKYHDMSNQMSYLSYLLCATRK